MDLGNPLWLSKPFIKRDNTGILSRFQAISGSFSILETDQRLTTVADFLLRLRLSRTKEAEIQGEQEIKTSSVSSASVKVAIKKILEEHTEKKLSDQAVTLILQKEGIKIARRTVAKYRSQLNIESSYRR